MQRDRHQDIELQAVRKRLDEQRAQCVRQRDLSPVFEEGNGILKRRTVGIGSPHLRVIGFARATVVALVGRAVAESRG